MKRTTKKATPPPRNSDGPPPPTNRDQVRQAAESAEKLHQLLTQILKDDITAETRLAVNHRNAIETTARLIWQAHAQLYAAAGGKFASRPA